MSGETGVEGQSQMKLVLSLRPPQRLTALSDFSCCSFLKVDHAADSDFLNLC